MKVLTVGENVTEMVVVFPSISFSLMNTVLNEVEVHGGGHSTKGFLNYEVYVYVNFCLRSRPVDPDVVC